MRKFRYIDEGHGKDSLSIHEFSEIEDDFDIDLDGFYVLVALTRKEWLEIKKEKKR